VLSTSKPCGEAVNEDDVESGSPFLYACLKLNYHQSACIQEPEMQL
jgi:hypothetical protein